MDLKKIIKALKKDRWKEIGIKTGFGYEKIRKLSLGHIVAPKYEDVMKLKEFYFNELSEKERVEFVAESIEKLINDTGFNFIRDVAGNVSVVSENYAKKMDLIPF